MARVAAITIVYNEKSKLPRWVEYYSRQLGPRNCFVVDHGSDDGSTESIKSAQLIRLPRTPYDNQIRVDAISSLAGFLLKYFNYVMYVDCDEFLVADPRLYSGIGDLCNKLNPEYLYSIGIDIVHKIDEESPLRPDEPVLQQRSYGHFSAAMCKPNLTRKQVQWARGFHSHQYPPIFGPLLNFHLRYVDLHEGLERLGVTRLLDWAKAYEGAHHKASDLEFEGMIRMWGRRPVLSDDPLTHNSGVLPKYLDEFTSQAHKPQGSETYNVNTFVFGDELIRIPEAFRHLF